MTSPLQHRSGHRLAALTALALAFALGWPPSADAQWSWRDRNGRVTASDRPPPLEIPEKDILTRPRSAAPAPAPIAPPASAPVAAGAAPAASTPQEAELLARKRAAEQQQAAQAEAEQQRLAALREQNCRQARNQLAALESGQRIARIGAGGQREVLDDAGRSVEIARTREAAAANCR